MKVKVLIADRHPAMRCGIRVFLESPEMQIVGEANSRDELLHLTKELTPDLVILGLNSTGREGIEACRELKEFQCPPYVLMYADFSFVRNISLCVSAGADSYLHKRTGRDFFYSATLRTAAGERIWEIGNYVNETSAFADAFLKESHGLSPREVEVLELKLRRASNAKIARALGISVHTVKRHVNAIYRKIPRKDIEKLH